MTFLIVKVKKLKFRDVTGLENYIWIENIKIYKDRGLVIGQARLKSVFYHHLQFLNFPTVQGGIKD